MKTINTITLAILAFMGIAVQYQIRQQKAQDNMIINEINELYSRINTNDTIDSLHLDFSIKHLGNFDARLDTLEHTAGWK